MKVFCSLGGFGRAPGIRAVALAGIALCVAHNAVEAQGRRDKNRPPVKVEATVSFGIELEQSIRAFYHTRPASGVKPLPPGIRKNLARGKPLPPGIAKRTAPHDLVAALSVPRGYEIVEVGLDVFLVEVATAVIHDVLLDVIR